MGLETGTYISDLVATNPVNATDVVGEGDDHLRLIKSTILNTFPSVTGEVSLTHTQLNNTVIKDERNTLTATISGLLYPLKFQGNLPGYAMEESDAALDEKFWDFVCTAGDLVYRTRTDANGAGETFFQVKRT